MTSSCRRSPHSPRGHGFTLAELLVALTVVSLVMIGVYGILRDALAAESASWLASESRGQAQAVADCLASSLERAVAVGSSSALVAGPDRQGNRTLSCLVLEPLRPDDPDSSWRLERRLYAWGAEAGGAEGEGVTLTQRRLLYAGSRIIWPPLDSEDAEDAEAALRQLPPQPVARRLGRVQVLFRPRSRPEAVWSERWEGSPADAVVRIRVTVGSETVERVITPKVNAALTEGG